MEHWNKIKELQKEISYTSWLAYVMGDKKIRRELILSTIDKYSVYSLLQIRFINKVKAEKDENKINLDYDEIIAKNSRTKTPLMTIINQIHDYSIEYSQPDDTSSNSMGTDASDAIPKYNFEIFLRNEKSKLLLALKGIFGPEFSWKQLQSDDENIRISLLDCGFFMYLLDAYNDPEMKHFRQQKYDLVDDDTLLLLKRGAYDLTESHKTTLSKIELKQKSEYLFENNKVKLDFAITKLRHTLSKIKNIENSENIQWLFKAMIEHINYSNEYLKHLYNKKDEIVEKKKITLDNIEFDL